MLFSLLEITILDSQKGLEQINQSYNQQAVLSSIGIVERALNQMEEYDFIVRFSLL